MFKPYEELQAKWCKIEGFSRIFNISSTTMKKIDSIFLAFFTPNYQSECRINLLQIGCIWWRMFGMVGLSAKRQAWFGTTIPSMVYRKEVHRETFSRLFLDSPTCERRAMHCYPEFRLHFNRRTRLQEISRKSI